MLSLYLVVLDQLEFIIKSLNNERAKRAKREECTNNIAI